MLEDNDDLVKNNVERLLERWHLTSRGNVWQKQNLKGLPDTYITTKGKAASRDEGRIEHMQKKYHPTSLSPNLCDLEQLASLTLSHM